MQLMINSVREQRSQVQSSIAGNSDRAVSLTRMKQVADQSTRTIRDLYNARQAIAKATTDRANKELLDKNLTCLSSAERESSELQAQLSVLLADIDELKRRHIAAAAKCDGALELLNSWIGAGPVIYGEVKAYHASISELARYENGKYEYDAALREIRIIEKGIGERLSTLAQRDAFLSGDARCKL